MRSPVLWLPVALTCAAIFFMVNHPSMRQADIEDQAVVRAHIAQLHAEEHRVRHDLKALEEQQIHHFLPRGGIN